MKNQNFDLLLKRTVFSDRSTIGKFYGWAADGSAVTELAFCLEDIVRPVGVKVPGKTAIPSGEYRIKITYSNRFKRDLPIIYTHEEYNGKPYVIVDGAHIWEGVRIHPGNTAEDTEGCLLPGTTAGKDYVYGSRVAFDQHVFPFIQNHPSLNGLGYLRFTIENAQHIIA